MTHIIDGASVRVKRNQTGELYLEYQPRQNAVLLWDVTYRERYGFSDGWSSEEYWAADKEEAFRQAPQHGRPFRESHVVPAFSREAKGWSVEQISQAFHWAIHTFTDESWTQEIARRFSPMAAE